MIRKYTDMDFPILERWITDADILFRFAGTEWIFPFTQEQMQAHIEKHPGGNRQFYLGLHDNGEPYAFGQIISGDANSPRLGRILVGEPEQRGKGLGQRFISELIEETRSLYPDEPSIYLYVFEDNLQGIGCYSKLGFTLCDEGHFILQHHGTDHRVMKMKLQV